MVTSSPRTPRPGKAPHPSSPDSPVREPGSSAGMAPATPAGGVAEPAQPGLALPHERDQSTAMTPAQPDAQVQQAGRDLARGLRDTGKSAPMDRAYDKLKR